MKPFRIRLAIISYGEVPIINAWDYCSRINLDIFESAFLMMKPVAKSRRMELDRTHVKLLSESEAALFLPGWQMDKRCRYLHELCKKMKIRVYYTLDSIPPF